MRLGSSHGRWCDLGEVKDSTEGQVIMAGDGFLILETEMYSSLDGNATCLGLGIGIHLISNRFMEFSRFIRYDQ